MRCDSAQMKLVFRTISNLLIGVPDNGPQGIADLVLVINTGDAGIARVPHTVQKRDGSAHVLFIGLEVVRHVDCHGSVLCLYYFFHNDYDTYFISIDSIIIR